MNEPLPTPPLPPEPTFDAWQNALRHDRVDLVKPWLEAHARMARVEFPSGQTLLTIAASEGASQCVAALIPVSDLHHDDGTGWTPMMHALGRRARDVAQALLTAAGPTTFDVIDDHGRTPLHLAAEKGLIEVVRAWMDRVPVSRVQEALQTTDLEGKTPWHEAAANGHLDLLQALVNRAGPVGLDRSDVESWTPLMYAVIQRQTSTARFLGPISPVAHTNDQGQTAVDLAVLNGEKSLEESLRLDAHRQEVAALRATADQAMGEPSPDRARPRL